MDSHFADSEGVFVEAEVELGRGKGFNGVIEAGSAEGAGGDEVLHSWTILTGFWRHGGSLLACL